MMMPTAALLVHLPQRRARREERAVQMNREQASPVGKRQLFEGSDDLNSRIAHQNIDPSERFDHLGHGAIDLRFAGNVHRDGNGLQALAIEFGRGQRSFRPVEIGDSDPGAGPGERASDLSANTAGPARDDGNLVLEARFIDSHALHLPRVARQRRR
jgi:hypothetical protein